LFDFFMAQSSQRFEPPQNTGRFSADFFTGLAGGSAFQTVRAFGESKHFVMQQLA